MRLFSRISWGVLLLASLASLAGLAKAQEMHDHGVPEKLGQVSFPITCAPAVQAQFNQGMALLHSFAYAPAEKAFEGVAAADPQCGMAHWGEAMTYFHPVWSPAVPAATFAAGQKEIQRAAELGAKSERERQFIHALGLIYADGDYGTYPARALSYERAMGAIATANPKDVESQVLYALSLLANESPSDKTHSWQKQAVDLLEPLYAVYPDHPGIAHYLIHACDSEELARRGLPAARAYAQIAPSAPHALHMPSHIFTRLGLWDDSIQSNIASKASAHQHGDMQGELHAMDYMVYAYLQTGQDSKARAVIDELKTMPKAEIAKAYPTTAMPVRYVIERGQWADAAAMVPLQEAPPEIFAISLWAKGLGLARTGHPNEAKAEATHLNEIAQGLRKTGNDYWALQTSVLAGEVLAWSAQAEGKTVEAVSLLRAAANQEDAVEKLPVTPGPIVPAREQLGNLLLQQKQPAAALKEFRTALVDAPNRRGSLQGAAQAGKLAAQSSLR